jgi:hypothetical protein
MASLQFEPESIESARERFEVAIEPIFDAYSLRPVLSRQHVFDFDDGVRLVVTRDRMGAEFRIHISASIAPGFDEKWASGEGFLESVQQHWRDLRGNEIHFMGFSKLGVPHFFEVRKEQVAEHRRR